VKLKDNLRLVWKDFRDWVVLFGSIATAAALVWALYEPLDKKLTPWVSDHVRLDGRGGIAVDERVHGVLAVVVLIAFFLLVGAVYSFWKLMRERGRAAQTDKANDVLTHTFQGTIKAAARISREMFPNTEKTVKKVIFFKQVCTLFDDGNCQVVETLIVEAGKQNLHFVEKSIRAEEAADAAPFPADIDLKIVSATPETKVSYLITENRPKLKKFAIFFLPVIRHGVSDVREIHTSYYWKGLLKQMVAQGEEDFDLQVNSVDTVPEMEFQFWVKPKIGTVECELIPTELPPAKYTLKPDSDRDKGFEGWIYKAEGVPVGHITQLKIKLKSA
jgi:hypothetical protein